MKINTPFVRVSAPVSVAMVVVGLLSLGTAALVYAHGGDVNLIHSCVKNSSGSIRIVGVSDTCNANETALDWNQKNSPGLGGLVENTTNADFSGADFRYRNLQGRNFSGSNLNGANLTHANLNDTNLSNVDLTGAILDNADLQNINVTGATFTSAHLNGVDLHGQNWSNVADVSVTLFNNANLSGFSSGGKSFHASGFERANLTNANFSNSDLQQSNFSFATVVGTNFSGADLSLTNFFNVHFINTNLFHAPTGGFPYSTFTNTICPDGTNSDNDGNTCANNLNF